MKGGKLLAEGGYGCVFLPAINCDGTVMSTKKYVSKIQRYDNSARTEIEIGRILQKVNGFLNHFSPVIKHCSLDIATIEDKDVKKCTVLKKKKTKSFITMKMLYINGSDFMDYLIKHKNSIQIVGNIINSFNHLLRALTILIKEKIVHYDLKGTNILFDIEKQVPLLIDFGLSIQLKKMNLDNIKNFFYVYAPEYYVWPLEVHYLCLIIHVEKNPEKKTLRALAKKFTRSNKGLTKNFSPEFLNKYENKCYDQLVKYSKFEYHDILEKLVNYWTTFDLYSLSIMYLKFISYMNIEGYNNNKFIIFFSQLLLKNINPDPEKRLNVYQTVHWFNGFLYKKNINNQITFEQIADEFIKERPKINKTITKDLEKHNTLVMKITRMKTK